MDAVGVGSAASTMTEMASDAAELENRLAAVLACVRGQVQELSDLHAVQSQTDPLMLVQLDGRLRELEVAADALQATYDTEKAQVERLEALASAAQRHSGAVVDLHAAAAKLNVRAERAVAVVPPPLPPPSSTAAVASAAASAATAPPASSVEAAPSIAPSLPSAQTSSRKPRTPRAGASSRPGMTRKRSGKAAKFVFQGIALVTNDELASVPKYVRGRLTLPKLNDAIAGINSIVEAKYKLLSQQPHKLTGKSLAMFEAYKGQVTKDLRKQRFFKMADVKGLAALKGATGTAILQSLRHLKRLRLVDGGYILQAS